MDKQKFIEEICIPHITVHLNILFLLRDPETKITLKKFDPSQYLEWFTPWYIDSEGKGSEHSISGSFPIKVKDVIQNLDPDYPEHKEHLQKIFEMARILHSDKSHLNTPIPPVVGFDENKTYFIFDGNHRIAASLLSNSLKEIEIFLISSKNISKMNANFAFYHNVFNQ